MAKNNNTNNNNGQNLINPIPNRNNNTSSTPDTVLEKVAENLGNLNNSMSETAKIMKDGFKQMTEHSKKQDKELNKAIGKLTSTIAENTKSNNDKNKKNNNSNNNNDSIEQRRQARQDRLSSKQDKGFTDFKNALAKLKKEIDDITDDTSEESKRLISNYEDLNKFFTEYNNSIDKVTGNLNEISLGADKFEKALRNINVSYGSSINELTKNIADFKNNIQMARNELDKNDRKKVEQAKKDIIENERNLKNAEKLLALQIARVKADENSAKLNKTIDDLRYNSELRKAEFEAKSAERSQKILDSFSDDVNSEFLKSVQSIQEYATKLEESYINTGEKGPLYNEISNTLNDMETALIKGDKESYKVNEAILKSLQQSRESIIGKGGEATGLDLMVAQQNADNAKKLALDVKAQQELADRYISNYNNLVSTLTNTLSSLESQRNLIEDKNSEDYKNLTEQINETQDKLSGALVKGAAVINATGKLASGDIKTRSETMLDSIKPEQEAIENQRAVNYKELAEILKLKENSDLSKEDKKELEEREKLLKKQNTALDDIEDQIKQMINGIQKGNLKSASKNLQNINKMKKNLEDMEKGQKGMVDTIKDSFTEMKNSYKPQGTISKLVSQGLKWVSKQIIDYNTQLQTNALSKLQQSYENQGMNIAKTNLVTRKEVQRMMGDIGNELESQGIKGIDTTDVMDMAESLANNGIRDQKVLKEMSVAMAKAGAMNPDLKATFSDIETVKFYKKMYDEAEKAGKDGGEVVNDYLMKAASNIYEITQVTGEAFAFTNGQLAEFESTLRESSNSLGLNTEQQDKYRKSVYALGAAVGQDTTNFSEILNKITGITTQGLSGDAFNVITRVTSGEDLEKTLRNGSQEDITKFFTNAYSELLTFDKSNGNEYNEGHKILMNTLGLNDDELQKIRNDIRYQTNGKFDISKFQEYIDNLVKVQTEGKNASKKQTEVLTDALMETKEQSDESKAINNLTSNFVALVGTDIPKIIDREIDIINASSKLIEDAIESGIDLIIGFMTANNVLGGSGGIGGGIGNLLGKGPSVGGMWGSGALGKAGVVGAGIAAFGAGWDIGTKLDKALGISEKVSNWLVGDVTNGYENDLKVQENLKKAQEDATVATNNLIEELKKNTDATKAVEKLEDEQFKKSKEKSTAAVKQAFTKSGERADDYVTANNSVRKSEGTAYLGDTNAKIAAQTNVVEAINSGDVDNYWDKYGEKYYKDAGLEDGQIKVIKEQYDKQLEQYNEIKEKYESFHSANANKLYEAWEWYKKHKSEYKSEAEAWNEALITVNEGVRGSTLMEHHTTGYVPVEGKDFEIKNGNEFWLKPGVQKLNEGDSRYVADYWEYDFRNIGKYATGLEEVPYDNYLALLHKGERVQTAAQVTQDKLQEELNDSLETLNTTLINSDNGIVETFDDTQLVNTIETQTNDMSNLINSVLEILNIIANNTKYNYNTTNSSGKSNYIENAIANRSTRISDFKNPTMY